MTAYTRTYPGPGYDRANPHGTLYACSLTPEQRARTCSYWYTVTDNSTAHTAFRTRMAFARWLADRGLALAADLPPEGEHGVQRIVGSYRQAMHLDYAEFYANATKGKHIRVMSNGQYTLGIITTDDDGIRTVHTLNPNCHERPVFDYRESQAMEDRGAA